MEVFGGGCHGSHQRAGKVEEEERKNERKHRREKSVPPVSSLWQCDEVGHVFVGQTKAGLVNHVRQIHGWMAEMNELCLRCGRMIRYKGVMMHKCYCRA